MSADSNKAMARRLLEEAFNAGNLDVDRRAGRAGVRQPRRRPARADDGIEARRRASAAIATAFPDLRITIEEQIAEGEYVTTRWSARGTHQGDLIGMAPPASRRR